jgi:hypothetical protein
MISYPFHATSEICRFQTGPYPIHVSGVVLPSLGTVRYQFAASYELNSEIALKSSGWYVFEFGTLYIVSAHKNFLSQTVLLYTVILVCHLYGDQARPFMWKRRIKIQQSPFARTYRKLKRKYSWLSDPLFSQLRIVNCAGKLLGLLAYVEIYFMFCGMLLTNHVGKYSFCSVQIISAHFTWRFSHNVMTHFFWFWSKHRNPGAVKALSSHVCDSGFLTTCKSKPKQF